MKKISLILMMLFSFVAVSSAQQQKMEMKKEHKMMSSSDMQTYFVEIPHTPEQCTADKQEMKAKGGDKLLGKFYYGCKYGNHTAYGFMHGKSEEDVRSRLPANAAKMAVIKPVSKFVTEQEMEKAEMK